MNQSVIKVLTLILALMPHGYIVYLNVANNPPTVDTTVALGSLSVLLLLIGWYFDNVVARNEFQKKMEKILPKGITSIEKFNNGKEALDYIHSQFNVLKHMKNTRIEKKSSSENRSEYSSYNTNILKFLKKKNSFFLEEVVSQAFLVESKERKSKCDSSYEYCYSEFIPPSFINFTILEYKGTKERELIFGWATGFKDNTIQPAFKCIDPRLIDYFDKVFYYFMKNA